MAYKSLSGKEVAVRILEAFEWADLDPYRAATHNKGIMNGIDAVAMATGQDWRAVEAGAHAWAGGAGAYSERSTDATPLTTTSSNSNQNGCKRRFGQNGDDEQSKIYRGDAYKPLTRYWIEEDEDRLRQGYKGQDALVFCGELEIPIMVGTKGGVLSTNPVHAFILGVMRYPDSKQLAMVRNASLPPLSLSISLSLSIAPLTDMYVSTLFRSGHGHSRTGSKLCSSTSAGDRGHPTRAHVTARA